MCEMMSKGSKEYLIVCNALNAIYVKGVERGKAIYTLEGLEDYVMYTLYLHAMLCQKGQRKYIRIQLVVMLCMSKESKDAQNML